MTSDSKAPVILWGRVERWRSEAPSEQPSITDFNDGKRIAIHRCADEIEADLRELQGVVQRVKHEKDLSSVTAEYMTTRILDSKDFPCLTSCPRCALEAKLGSER